MSPVEPINGVVERFRGVGPGGRAIIAGMLKLDRIYLVALALVAGLLVRDALTVSPREALREFYRGAQVRPEEQLMDPLILAGRDVAPLVAQEARRRGMPLRRYAILFLGNQGYADALPLLRGILGDEGEADVFRANALQAIAMIDRDAGLMLAAAHSQRDDYLGRAARGMLAGEPDWFERRTRTDALLRRKS